MGDDEEAVDRSRDPLQDLGQTVQDFTGFLEGDDSEEAPVAPEEAALGDVAPAVWAGGSLASMTPAAPPAALAAASAAAKDSSSMLQATSGVKKPKKRKK